MGTNAILTIEEIIVRALQPQEVQRACSTALSFRNCLQLPSGNIKKMKERVYFHQDKARKSMSLLSFGQREKIENSWPLAVCTWLNELWISSMTTFNEGVQLCHWKGANQTDWNAGTALRGRDGWCWGDPTTWHPTESCFHLPTLFAY